MAEITLTSGVGVGLFKLCWLVCLLSCKVQSLQQICHAFEIYLVHGPFIFSLEFVERAYEKKHREGFIDSMHGDAHICRLHINPFMTADE